MLYVITSVSEQVFPGFDSAIKDQLAAIRFPHYYMCGFGLLITSIATGAIGLRGRQRIFVLIPLACAAGLMVYDYYSIYQPLLAAITPPGQTRTEQFTQLHNSSKHINQIGLSLALIAGFIAAWPQSVTTTTTK